MGYNSCSGCLFSYHRHNVQLIIYKFIRDSRMCRSTLHISYRLRAYKRYIDYCAYRARAGQLPKVSVLFVGRSTWYWNGGRQKRIAGVNTYLLYDVNPANLRMKSCAEWLPSSIYLSKPSFPHTRTVPRLFRSQLSLTDKAVTLHNLPLQW